MIYGPIIKPLGIVRAPSWANVGFHLYWIVNSDGKAVACAEHSRQEARRTMARLEARHAT